MTNIEVKEFKIKIGKKDYLFRLDFKALLKFNNKYENGIEIFNNFLSNKDIYGCIIKILSCACTTKDFTEEELMKGLSFNFGVMTLMDQITNALIEGIMVEKETTETEETNTEKNG